MLTMSKVLLASALLASAVQGMRTQSEVLGGGEKSELNATESGTKVNPKAWQALMALLLAYNPSPAAAFTLSPGPQNRRQISVLGSSPMVPRVQVELVQVESPLILEQDVVVAPGEIEKIVAPGANRWWKKLNGLVQKRRRALAPTRRAEISMSAAAEDSEPGDEVFSIRSDAEIKEDAQEPKPPTSDLNLQPTDMSEITVENPLKVVIAGAGVGGLALANDLLKDPRIQVTVIERTGEFKRFGGPIQLASNALQVLKEMDEPVFDQIMEKFTFTGDKENGIKDGIRDEWYAKFDLGGPADSRGMPYTGVIERPDLQEIYLKALPKGVVQNGDGVASYRTEPDGKGVTVITESGAEFKSDVVIGADGIWSSVRATMRNEPEKGEGSGASYSGYTVFAGELTYDSYDNGAVGYKVFIGPSQYFVITDIGNGRYQWYAFLGREPNSAESEEKPDGSVAFLKDLFTGWSGDIHKILDATREDEIGQRDLYDRPPSVAKPWTDGPVALLGDAVHAMMPNLGQGGCQALEDSFVIAQELKSATNRGEINGKLQKYRNRRLIRASTVQGLSRFASDIIINGFDTPAKIVFEGGLRFENFNYAGVVTKLLQPILPVFFSLQFNFLYEGWRNEQAIDYKAALGIAFVGFSILLAGAGFDAEVGLGLGAGLEAVFGADGVGALLTKIGEMM